MTYTLKEARLLSELSQIEISKMLNMTEKTYIQYEKYRRIFRMDQAAKFCENVIIPMDKIKFFEH